MTDSAIYKITCTANGRFYVGSAKSFRIRKRIHLSDLRLDRHHSRHMQRSWNKYGPDAFVFEVLERVEDPADLLLREQHYLDVLNPAFNSAKFAGNTLGCRPSEEALAKIRRAAARRKGQPRNMKGKTHRKEARAKMSTAKKGKPSFFKGRKHSPASKQKMATRQRNRNHPTARPVEQIDLDGTLLARFESIAAAQRATRITKENIRNVLTGRAFTAGGFFWRSPGDEEAMEKLREAQHQDARHAGRRGGRMLPRLKELRKLKGWTQQQLHDQSGVKQTTISDLETGRRWAQARTVVKLSRALGVTSADLTEPRL